MLLSLVQHGSRLTPSGSDIYRVQCVDVFATSVLAAMSDKVDLNKAGTRVVPFTAQPDGYAACH
jgi:hypothetical protein